MIDMVDKFTLQDAINRIRLELQKDKQPGSYYHTWQCNIAMCFYDAYRHRWAFPEDHGIMQAIHETANQAAVNFLEILCSQSNDNIGLIRQSQLQESQQTKLKL